MTTSRRAAIVAPVRTPVGTFGGSLRAVPVEELAAPVVVPVQEREPEHLDVERERAVEVADEERGVMRVRDRHVASRTSGRTG